MKHNTATSPEQLIAALKAANNTYIDDHLRGADKDCKAHAIGIQGAEVVLLLPKEKIGFSVNPLYLDKDGKVHLSTFSTGGVVYMRGRTLEQAVEVYNDPEQWMCTPKKIEDITYLN